MIERLGVYPKWKNDLKKRIKLCQKMDEHNVDWEKGLHEYAFTGEFSKESLGNKPEVIPPWCQWELTRLEIGTRNWSLMHQRAIDLPALVGMPVSFSGLYVMFKLSYISNLIGAHMHVLFSQRFGREYGNDFIMREVTFATLGFILNKDHEASRFFRLLIKSFNEQNFIYQGYAIFDFMLRIVADYLGEPINPPTGKAATEELFHQLLQEWKNPDPEAIKELCLAACDYHTHRCKPDKGNEWNEFDNGAFSSWPIEMNLLFELRKRLGLQNPVLEHPLMDAPLANIPENLPCELDELSIKVFAKMKEQGFDEDEVFQRIYYGSP
jgi:hypothetical protein